MKKSRTENGIINLEISVDEFSNLISAVRLAIDSTRRDVLTFSKYVYGASAGDNPDLPEFVKELSNLEERLSVLRNIQHELTKPLI